MHYCGVYTVNAYKIYRTHPVTDRQMYLQIQPTSIPAGTFSEHVPIDLGLLNSLKYYTHSTGSHAEIYRYCCWVPTVHLSKTNLGTFCGLCCKNLLLDFKFFFDSPIKLNELYGAVEKHLQKNFWFLQDKHYNVPYRLSTYKMYGGPR